MDLSSFENKVKPQYLVFPVGITYSKENDAVRTKRVNSIFAEIPMNTGVSTKKQNENSSLNDHSASSVVLPVQFSNLFIMDLKRLASIVA